MGEKGNKNHKRISILGNSSQLDAPCQGAANVTGHENGN
jgi:hypothetical protein